MGLDTSEIREGGSGRDRPGPRHAGIQMHTPDELFGRLVLFKKLISYAGDYDEIIGPRPSQWNQYIHNRKVTQKACESSVKVVEGLSVQLDALIVNAVEKRPGAGHYEGKQYTEKQWLKAFGGWGFEEIA